MVRAMYTAASGMMVESRKQDRVAGNLYYAQIPGFKAASLLTAAKVPTDPASPSDVQTALTGQYVDAGAGPLRPTQKPLDLALEGSGLFAVQTDGGTAYTRDGRFTRHLDGSVRDGNGNALLGEKGPIAFPKEALPEAKVSVERDGTFLVDGKTVDRIVIKEFEGYKGLQAAGGRLFFPTGAVQPAASKATVVQSTLEDANVSGVAEMVRMVETTRAFESYQKVLQTIDEVTGQAVSRLGRLG